MTSIQKKVLTRYYHHYRYTYNKCIGIINDRLKPVHDFSWVSELGEIEQRGYTSNNYTNYELRNMVVPESCNPFSEWVLNTPFQVRAYAVFEANDNYKKCLSNHKKGNIKSFYLGFKKRDKRWTINIPKNNIYKKDDKTFSFYVENGDMKTTEKIIDINHDCKIHFDGIYYYIIVPYKKEIKPEKPKNNWCSIDPGSRKFCSIYTPDDQSNIFVGEKASKKLHGLLLHLDNIISKLDKKPNRDLRRKKIYLMNKIKNLQQELHRKLSYFLCENYKNILIPKLTKNNDIVSKKNRKIKTKTVRMMTVLGHCKFVDMLKTKANNYTDVNVEIVTEEYTSQTCLDCKTRTKTSNETFKCSNCGFVLDRDVMGSINVFLKHFELL